MCSTLNVSRSGYYDWSGRRPSARAQANQTLDERIQVIFARHRQRYGAPRIVTELQDEGVECSENRVARRMQILELKAVQAKKFKVTTDSNHKKPVAPDLLEQDFSASAMNQKWTSDIRERLIYSC
jgi:transposase InsO family protein